MKAIFQRMALEVVRLCPLSDRAGAIVTVVLSDAPGAGSRARGSALYRVALHFSWLDAWGTVRVVDIAGNDVELTFTAIAGWLAKSLAGWPVTLAFEFNAGRLSPVFGGVRALRHADYMAWLDGSGMQDTAAALRAEVANLPFDAERRERVEARATVLDGVADSLQELAAAAMVFDAGGVAVGGVP